VLGKPPFHAGYKIAAISFIVGMLQLTPPAFREVSAGRLLVMGTKRKRTIVKHRIAGNAERDVSPTCGDAIPAGRNSDD
jgi:hypothetical protein